MVRFELIDTKSGIRLFSTSDEQEIQIVKQTYQNFHPHDELEVREKEDGETRTAQRSC